MGVRKAGRRKAGTNGGIWRGHQIYEYSSPKVNFESDKLSEEELAKLSGEVKTYQLEEGNEKK